MEEFILKKSNRKGKRFEIVMPRFGHSHHFGSDIGSTYIDHKDDKKKKAWYARHKKNKNFNSLHSGIYHSKELLWTEPTLDKAIKEYEKKHNVKIKKMF
tara:strand:+ start:486 stop:782 length:297 start_codon:yes stop_codon:yes gene_type:complete